MDKTIGAQFRKEILEVGGSRDPAESVRAFLGRDWNTDAFFEEMGLDADGGGDASAKDVDDESSATAPRIGLLFSYLLGVAATALWWY